MSKNNKKHPQQKIDPKIMEKKLKGFKIFLITISIFDIISLIFSIVCAIIMKEKTEEILMSTLMILICMIISNVFYKLSDKASDKKHKITYRSYKLGNRLINEYLGGLSSKDYCYSIFGFCLFVIIIADMTVLYKFIQYIQ